MSVGHPTAIIPKLVLLLLLLIGNDHPTMIIMTMCVTSSLAKLSDKVPAWQPSHNWVAISIIIGPCSWEDDSHCESRLDGREESARTSNQN